MSELRLILLIAGLLFIAGIAGFEWWRARRTADDAAPPALTAVSAAMDEPESDDDAGADILAG